MLIGIAFGGCFVNQVSRISSPDDRTLETQKVHFACGSPSLNEPSGPASSCLLSPSLDPTEASPGECVRMYTDASEKCAPVAESGFYWSASSRKVSGYPVFYGHASVIDQRLFNSGWVLKTTGVLVEHVRKNRMAPCSRFIVSSCLLDLGQCH